MCLLSCSEAYEPRKVSWSCVSVGILFYMSVGLSLIFLGVALAAASFGGVAVLHRLGENGSSCALSATAGSIALIYSILALLPHSEIPSAAMLPLLVMPAALGVGWITDTASMRLPHTTANTALAVVSIATFFGWLQIVVETPALPAGVVIAAMTTPTVAGVVFSPPTVRSVIWWYSLGVTSMAGCVIAAFVHPDISFATGLTLVIVFAVGVAVLIAGRLLVWAGQAGGGDPVWLASFTVAASAHAVLSAGKLLTATETMLIAVMGASTFFIIGGLLALLMNAARRVFVWFLSKRYGQADSGKKLSDVTQETLQFTLAGQWSALGLIGFVIAWKFTPLGENMTETWFSSF